jgi:PEP-CTERM putative exosortase interaction domain
MKKASAIAASALITCTPAFSSLLDFEGLVERQAKFIPIGYGGFTWENILAIDTRIYGGDDTSVTRSLVSGNSVAYGAGQGYVYSASLSTINGELFDFAGAHFTAIAKEYSGIIFRGYAGDVQLYSDLVFINNVAPTYVELNYSGINRITFDGEMFAMDNFSYSWLTSGENPSSVPEPSTALLVSLGIMASYFMANRFHSNRFRTSETDMDCENRLRHKQTGFAG